MPVPGGPAVTGLRFLAAAGMLVLGVVAAGFLALEGMAALMAWWLSW